MRLDRANLLLTVVGVACASFLVFVILSLHSVGQGDIFDGHCYAIVDSRGNVYTSDTEPGFTKYGIIYERADESGVVSQPVSVRVNRAGCRAPTPTAAPALPKRKTPSAGIGIG